MPSEKTEKDRFIDLDDLGSADDNIVQSFQLEESNLRGRIVRLGSVLDDILQPHNYPLPLAHLVAEAVSLSLLLSSMLKYEGIFTFQAQGDGPVKMIVSDATSAGEVRACATFDNERLQKAREQLKALKTDEGGQNHLAQYLGKGYIAFTVDQGKHTDRYQGIVELKGASLIDCVQHYFSQSEQIGTGIKLSAGLREGKWRAGGIMLQKMPEDELEEAHGNIDEDAWRRSMIFLDSATDEEFLAPSLHSNILLNRLFHEEGVRVYEPKPVSKGCRCSVERVEAVLLQLPKEDREFMTKDKKITMHCEFCNKDFIFDPKKVEKNAKAQK